MFVMELPTCELKIVEHNIKLLEMCAETFLNSVQFPLLYDKKEGLTQYVDICIVLRARLATLKYAKLPSFRPFKRSLKLLGQNANFVLV